MEQLAHTTAFSHLQNIVLQGFDPIAAGGFTQVPNLILNNKDLSFAAKVVYAKLLSYAWNNNRVFPGQETMAEELGTSQPTIARSVKELEDIGYLEIQRRGQGLTNLYILRHTVKPKTKK
jgi:hypothetical protein